ncbi:MFS transporter [Arcanobacterium haemolyticum]|nr:MFS transporter [Arcanobacterium haemolyticum]
MTSSPQREYAAIGAALAGVIVVVSLNLRPALTSVGPVSDLIQADAGLTTAAMGLIASIPVFCMGLGALMTPLVIRRIGMDATVTAALAILGVVVAIRSFIPGVGLWVGTVGVGLTIGFLNAVLPPIIKRDFPMRSTGVTGLYSASLTISAALASGVAVPIAGASSWRLATGIWIVLVVTGLIAWGWSKRARARIAAQGAAAGKDMLNASAGAGEGNGDDASFHAAAHDGTPVLPEKPVWRIPLAWAVTSFMGLQSFLFYTFVQWLPDLEKSHGVSAGAAGVHMMVFQIAGLVSTLTITALQGERPDQRPATVATAVSWALGISGMLLAPGAALVWVILMGLGSGASFYVALSFISTRTSTTSQASAVSGMSQSVGYFIAAVGPTLAGMLAEAVGWNGVLCMALVVNIGLLLLGLVAGRPVKM